jgi:hypothetical protein
MSTVQPFGIGAIRCGLVCVAIAALLLDIPSLPARAQAGGTLSVISDPPGALVYVDGREAGKTPAEVTGLSEGDHRIRIALDGYLENSQTITIIPNKPSTLRVRLTSRTGAPPSSPAAADTANQTDGLKIVVIEGEDSVNIIDQKTAVPSIVEVRDRNDLPVAGAAVTFLIQGGGKTAVLNNGLSTVTLTTNAAGRATVAINPLARGAVQVQVSATYQGQTASTIISQTNFANAAQAAQAANAGGGSGTTSSAGAGGSGGGGGLSTLAIAGIAGGAGVGGLVAYNATKKDPCSYAVSPTSINFTGSASTANVDVVASPPDCDPEPWTAAGSSFVSVSPSSGSGSGSVGVSVPANTTAPRSATITIAGQTVTVNQSVPCVFTVTPTTVGPLPSASNTVTVTVTASPSGCSPSNWTASASGFISVSPTSGSGNGTVTLTLAANTAAQRTGTATIAGRAVSVTQAGACSSQNIAGGDVPETRIIDLGRRSGTFTFAFDTQSVRDRLTVSYEGRVLYDSGCVGTNGTRTVNIAYSGNSTTVSVQVTPNCQGGSGTAWAFTLSCPR